MKSEVTLSSLSKEELKRIFNKNSEYIEYVLQSTLRTNAELYLKQLLNQLAATNLHLNYKIYSNDQYHIEIESRFTGGRAELLDVIYAFNDVYPEVLDEELLDMCEDLRLGVVELETAFINTILNTVLAFLKITDWKSYFLEHTEMFDAMEFDLGDDNTLYRAGGEEEDNLN